MQRWLTAALSLGASLLMAGPASAGFVFTFSNIGDIPGGGTRTVNVFIHWDGTGTNILTPANGGLSEADFGLRLLNSSAGTVTVANPTGSDVSANMNFDFQQGNAPGTPGFTNVSGYTSLAALQLGLIANPPVTSSGSGNIGGSADTLYLGSFTLTAGPNNGPNPLAVTLRAYVRNTQTTDNFQDASFNSLDSQIANSTADDATFNITPVPEPGSIALVGLAMSSLGGMAWRKRRTLQPIAATTST
jgi:hypothetical protein